MKTHETKISKLENDKYCLDRDLRSERSQMEKLEEKLANANSEMNNCYRLRGLAEGELRGYREGVTQMTQKALPVTEHHSGLDDYSSTSGAMGIYHRDDGNYRAKRRS